MKYPERQTQELSLQRATIRSEQTAITFPGGQRPESEWYDKNIQSKPSTPLSLETVEIDLEAATHKRRLSKCGRQVLVVAIGSTLVAGVIGAIVVSRTGGAGSGGDEQGNVLPVAQLD